LSAEFRKLLDSIYVYKCKNCGVQTLSQAKPEKCPTCGKKVGVPEQEGIRRPGLSFYTLRHTFQTIGDETGDYLAVRRVMGHSDNSISDHYRERFQDERLRKVVDYVRGWLLGKSEGTTIAVQ
jgi:DNA-directed RNA polymerase subunit RPC12/RpoP